MVSNKEAERLIIDAIIDNEDIQVIAMFHRLLIQTIGGKTMQKLTALFAIQGMATEGVTQINEATIKNWFFNRPYIHTTGKEIKECLMEVGIKLRPCKDYIPSSYMPLVVTEEVYKEIFESREELYDLYITKKIAPANIARVKKCLTKEVYSNLDKFKIEMRTGHGLQREYKRKFKI